MIVDLGIRCDRHAGEAFLPRCYACLGMTAEWRAITHDSGERPDREHDREVSTTPEFEADATGESEATASSF